VYNKGKAQFVPEPAEVKNRQKVWTRAVSPSFEQMLPLKMPARHVIIAETETKPESRNQTSGRMEDTNKPVQERPGPDRPRRLYNRDLKK